MYNWKTVSCLFDESLHRKCCPPWIWPIRKTDENLWVRFCLWISSDWSWDRIRWSRCTGNRGKRHTAHQHLLLLPSGSFHIPRNQVFFDKLSQLKQKTDDFQVSYVLFCKFPEYPGYWHFYRPHQMVEIIINAHRNGRYMRMANSTAYIFQLT